MICYQIAEDEFYPILSESEYAEKYFKSIEDRFHKNKDYINKLKENLNGCGLFEFDELFEEIKVMINPHYYPFTNKKISFRNRAN